MKRKKAIAQAMALGDVKKAKTPMNVVSLPSKKMEANVTSALNQKNCAIDGAA